MRRLTESVCLDSEGAALLEDVDDLLGDGLTGGEGAEDGSKPVSGETERGHRAGGGGAWGQEGRLQESCQSGHHSVVTHIENPALFMVEVTLVLRNHTLDRTLDDVRPGAKVLQVLAWC